MKNNGNVWLEERDGLTCRRVLKDAWFFSNVTTRKGKFYLKIFIPILLLFWLCSFLAKDEADLKWFDTSEDAIH